MQDAVIAVSDDGSCNGRQAHESPGPQGARLQQPVVETIRDPDFLSTVREATASHEVKTARATSIVPAAPSMSLPPFAWRRRRRGASRPYRNRARGKTRRDFIQRFPRTPHAADFHTGLRRNSARLYSRKRRAHSEFLESSANPDACPDSLKTAHAGAR